MKKLLNVFVALVFVLSLAVLTGCKCKKDEPKEVSATGYGIVHKSYVGIADITVKDGKVTALKFEEVYLPDHWAGLDEAVADASVVYTSRNKDAYAAKYVMVGDKKFTASVSEDKKTVTYSAEGIVDLKAWINESEANAEWYAKELLAGNAKATDASWNKLSAQITADKEGGFTKSATGYWSGDNYPLGWKGNMAALEEALIGTSMGFKDADLVKDETSKLWSFAGTVTKATLTDAKDYVAVAQRAYDKATK